MEPLPPLPPLPNTPTAVERNRDALVERARAACRSACELRIVDRELRSHIDAYLHHMNDAATTAGGNNSMYGMHGVSMPERLIPAYTKWLHAHLEVESARAAATTGRGGGGTNTRADSSAVSISGITNGMPLSSFKPVSHSDLAHGRFRDSVLYNKTLRGLTNSERRIMWPVFARAWMSTRDRNRLPTSVDTIVALSASLDTLNAAACSQIDKDVTRGLPGLPNARPDLIVHMFRLLRAYAAHSPETGGYTQGMHVLAGVVLMFIDDNDVDAFAVFAYLVEYVLAGFDAKLTGIRADMKVLEYYVKRRAPKVYEQLRAIGVDVTLIGVPWFMRLFVTDLPIECALRVWDRIIIYGAHVVFETSLQLIIANEHVFSTTTAAAATQSNSIDTAGALNALRQAVEETFDFDVLSSTSIGTPLLPSMLAMRRSEACNAQKRSNT